MALATAAIFALAAASPALEMDPQPPVAPNHGAINRSYGRVDLGMPITSVKARFPDMEKSEFAHSEGREFAHYDADDGKYRFTFLHRRLAALRVSIEPSEYDALANRLAASYSALLISPVTDRDKMFSDDKSDLLLGCSSPLEPPIVCALDLEDRAMMDHVPPQIQEIAADDFANRDRIAKSRGHTIHSLHELMAASPYATEGKCYRIAGEVTQWQDATTALVRLGNSPTEFAMVEFESPPDTKAVRGVGLGQHAFQYTNAIGTLATVPYLKIVSGDKAPSPTPEKGDD
jgi:hypothetical protein